MELDEFHEERGNDEEGLSEAMLSLIKHSDSRPVEPYDYCSEGDNGDHENLGLMIT